MSDQPEILYCANHPTVETTLRCNRCEKPICSRCAVLTPTGYRCKECVRGQQRQFDTATWLDYPLTIAIAGLLAYIGSQIVPVLGFFTIFLAPIAGVIIAEAIRMVIRKRRSKRLFLTATIAAGVGSAPPLLMILIGMLAGGGFGVLLALVWQGVYTFTVISTVYYRLSGIRL
jgi:hypothetical protein